MLTTIAAFIFSLGGLTGNIHVVDGKGGTMHYMWVDESEKQDCKNTNKAIIFTSGNHGWKYFCEVK